MDPFVGKSDSSGFHYLVSQGDRPPVLDEHNGGAAALGNRVGEVPHLGVAEEMAVLHFLRSGFSRANGFLLTAGAETDQRTDNRPKLDRVVLRQVALLDDLELTTLRFRHEQEVDDPDGSLVLQP